MTAGGGSGEAGGTGPAGDQAELEARDRELAEQSERLDAIRRRVLNVIGHELRTPVTTLRGLADSAVSAVDADPEELRETILPALARSARRLEELVDEMLVAAGVTTAHPVDPPERVALAGAVRSAWSNLPMARARAAELPDLAVEGNREATVPSRSLEMILVRVLDNAAKYSPAPSVVIGADGERARVTVDAPGPEMHPEEVELATEAFFRGEHAVMSAPGMGLGLAVAKAIAEQAGGSLRVEALDGGGLRTVIELEAA